MTALFFFKNSFYSKLGGVIISLVEVFQNDGDVYNIKVKITKEAMTVSLLTKMIRKYNSEY